MTEMDNQYYPWKKEYRREQNKLAKQRSRQRQKDREELLGAQRENCERYPAHHGIFIDNNYVKNFVFPCCAENNDCTDSPIRFKEFLRYFSSPSELANVAKILEAENLGFIAVLKYGIILEGGAINESVLENANDMCCTCSLKFVMAGSRGYLSIKAALKAGAQMLAHLKGPLKWRFETCEDQLSSGVIHFAWTNISVPRPINLPRLSHIAAFLSNARQLRVSFQDIANDDADSPFTATEQRKHATSCYLDLSPDIQPVREQLLIPHHPYIDLIPFPSFRTKVLSALNANPPKFREDELCFDLMNDGLRCWGSCQISLHGRGHGVPWDARSWQVAPWFLKKWSILFADANDPVYNNNIWWSLYV